MHRNKKIGILIIGLVLILSGCSEVKTEKGTIKGTRYNLDFKYAEGMKKGEGSDQGKVYLTYYKGSQEADEFTYFKTSVVLLERPIDVKDYKKNFEENSENEDLDTAEVELIKVGKYPALATKIAGESEYQGDEVYMEQRILMVELDNEQVLITTGIYSTLEEDIKKEQVESLDALFEQQIKSLKIKDKGKDKAKEKEKIKPLEKETTSFEVTQDAYTVRYEVLEEAELDESNPEDKAHIAYYDIPNLNGEKTIIVTKGIVGTMGIVDSEYISEMVLDDNPDEFEVEDIDVQGYKGEVFKYEGTNDYGYNCGRIVFVELDEGQYFFLESMLIGESKEFIPEYLFEDLKSLFDFQVKELKIEKN